MKKLVAAGLLAVGIHAFAAQDITLSADQIGALGIVTAAPVADRETAVSSLTAIVVVPNSQMHVISAPLPGLVETLSVAVGQQVRRGQALANLKSPQLAEAQRDFLQAAAQHMLARDNLKRDRQLYDEGIVAESRLRATQVAEQTAGAAYSERRQALRLMGMSDAAIARLQASRAIGSSLTLSAPADGVILDQLATVGQRVESAAPIYRLARLDPLWLEIHAPASRAATLTEGASVSVPAFDAAGKLIAIGRSVDPDSQTVLLRAAITRNARNLRPGQRVEVSVGAMAPGADSAWRIPREALVRQGDQAYVFARSAAGFRPLPVRVLHEAATAYTVSGALDARAPIAVKGASALKAKMLGLGGE